MTSWSSSCSAERCCALALCAAILAAASSAAADDWLLQLPAATAEARAQDGPALLYPADGLPAVVHAGETLVARVRVVAALTPPPGRQQPAALAPWTASLDGHAVSVGDARGRHYALHPQRVRPDGASSLIYRLALAIPAWTAPGTYTLSIEGPGGAHRAVRGVAVLAAGAAPRLAWLPAAVDASARHALSMLPVDVWLGTDGVNADAWAAANGGLQADGGLQPVLSTDLGSAALRVGATIRTLPACGAATQGGATRFARLAQELRLPARCLPARPDAAPPPDSYRTLAGMNAALAHPTGTPKLGVPWPLAAHGPLELDVTLPHSDGGYRITGARAAFFAATVPGAQARSLAARLTADGRSDALTIAALPGKPGPAPRLVVDPMPPRAGQPATLSLSPRSPDARVAWTVGVRASGFDAGSRTHRFDATGPVTLTAQVLRPDGTTATVRRRIEIAPTGRSGCSLSPPAGCGQAPGGPGGWLPLLFGLSAWRTRRRRRRQKCGHGPQRE